jgi:trehalose synthase-fused probable maltokinase
VTSPAAALSVRGPWHRILSDPERPALEARLPGHLSGQRWFGAKARTVAAVRIEDAVGLGADDGAPWLALLQVAFAEGPGEIYLLPVAWSEAGAGAPGEVIAPLTAAGRPGLLCGAEHDPAFARALLADVARSAVRPGARGNLVASHTGAFQVRAAGAEDLSPAPLGAEQSNTSIRFGDRAILKLFRRTSPGINPDLELGAYLTDVVGYPHVAPTLGSLEYRPAAGPPLAVGVLSGFVANQGDAWRLALRSVGNHLAPHPGGSAPPRDAGGFAGEAALLGRRTAELHLALAARPDLPAFAPEPFTVGWQAAQVEALRAQAARVLPLLEQRLGGMAEVARAPAAEVLARRADLLRRTAWLLDRSLAASRIRIHGDYHLGQVLWTGSDFVLIDFEGEPARPLDERRDKGSALRDVAGMLRSFHYAAHAGGGAGAAGADRQVRMELWHRQATSAFLEAYLGAAGGAPFLPPGEEERRGLLELHLLEKALYELGYELNSRPDWVWLPLTGLAELLAAG